MQDLKNKTALVTGASRGIGKAIALALSDGGINVAINYHRSKEKAEELCKVIESKNVKVLPIQADVSNSDEVERMIKQVEIGLGHIDILINNAGIAVRKEILETTEHDFDHMILMNLKSSFLVTQAVLPGMIENKWGRIIFISSVAAQIGGNVGLHYAASKAGQIGMMHFYASHIAKDGITVNAIAPGMIETEMLHELKDFHATRIPIGRYGKAEEIADTVMMLINNGFITNQTINIDGGIHPSS